ncbi:hypothetical protein SAMN05421823_102364 [Catalinimonas alkaloidigena]|uniref:Uncharacterized protein n=1 Tax=Catalinimonas alkaloidigena TaxID=1075417 RepID=A0A1G9AQV1_9BACT|nr:hypothetical protein [Catalinimonas alkaloidigena]SDK28980.1 hypothetical protein SAMN05421823_102364 [Catalinimonas alkaloidigena]
MKNRTLLACFSLLVLFSSCQRSLDDDDLIFRGDWSSRTYALQIFSNGYGVCNTRKWGGLTCEGYVKIRDRHLVFVSNTDDSTLDRKRFRIDQRPTVDADGVVYMELSGERFERH